MAFQPVMIREDLLPDVHAFLAERMREGTPAADTDEEAAEERSWTVADAEQLARRTNEPVIALMDMCVETRPEPVSTSEFCARTGISMPTLRSGLGGLTRTIKAYLLGLPYPIQSAWGPDMGRESAEQYYWLTDEVAEIWKRVRSTE